MFGIIAIIAVTCQHFPLVDAYEADPWLAHEDYDYDDKTEDATLDTTVDFARLLQEVNSGGEGEGEGGASEGGATPFPTPKPPTPAPTDSTPAPTEPTPAPTEPTQPTLAPTPPSQTLAPPTPVPTPARVSVTYGVQLFTKAAAFDAEAFKKAMANATGVQEGQGVAELDFTFTFKLTASYSAPILVTNEECVSLMAGVYNISEASIKCEVNEVAGDIDNAVERRLAGSNSTSIMDVTFLSVEQNLIEGIETLSADTSSIRETIATQLDVPVEAVVETKTPQSSVDVAVKLVAEANSGFVEVEPETLAEEVSKELGVEAKVEIREKETVAPTPSSTPSPTAPSTPSPTSTSSTPSPTPPSTQSPTTLAPTSTPPVATPAPPTPVPDGPTPTTTLDLRVDDEEQDGARGLSLAWATLVCIALAASL